MALLVELLMTMRVGHLSGIGERKAITTTLFKSFSYRRQELASERVETGKSGEKNITV